MSCTQLLVGERTCRKSVVEGKNRKMEKAAAIGTSHNLYRPSTGPWKSSIGEVIRESDDTVIRSQEYRLLRWAKRVRA